METWRPGLGLRGQQDDLDFMLRGRLPRFCKRGKARALLLQEFTVVLFGWMLGEMCICALSATHNKLDISAGDRSTTARSVIGGRIRVLSLGSMQNNCTNGAAF